MSKQTDLLNLTDAITVDSSNNVGIGTTSPLGNVTVANPAGANAPTSVTAANAYLQLGSDEYGPSNNGKFMIGFGYTDATNTNSPAYIGFEEVSTSGDTYGDLTFYTRGVTTDTAPSERMRIDASGRVTLPYQPAFRAYLTSNTSQPSGVSSASGTFATNYNVGGHYSTSTKRFTAPVSGSYLFTGTIATIGGMGSFSYLSCEFWVNGSRTFIGGWQGNSSPSYSKSVSSVVLILNANDYVELACETNKTFTLQGGTHNYTYMSGYLLG